MARHRQLLPQLAGGPFITDGGIETTLIFHEGLDLPSFAAFDLLRSSSGTDALRKYFRTYTELARRHQLGIVLESATWRANRDWGLKLGYGDAELAEMNRQAIALLRDLRAEYDDSLPMVLSACIGPRGDGYNPAERMSAGEAEEYHRAQMATFRETDADLVSAITMNYVEEAIGIARAAQKADMPVVISFTVETDGNLPAGDTLRDAVMRVDEETGGGPAYYMINCAHPSHFARQLVGDGWLTRIRGVRANASQKSHAELNESSELDEGNPVEFARDHEQMLQSLPWINVLGGCCGTDDRHVDAICRLLHSEVAA